MWKKVAAPTALVILLWVAASGATTQYIGWVYETFSRVLAENVTTIQEAGALQAILWRMQATVMEAAAKGQRETYVEVTEQEAAFQRHLEEAERTAYTEEERNLVKIIRQHFAIYQDSFHQWLRSQQAADPAAQPPAEKVMRLARAVDVPCQQLLELNRRLLAEATARSNRLGTMVTVARLGFLATGLVVGVFYGWWVARSLHHSIAQISITLRDATGELQEEVGRVEISRSGGLLGLQQQVHLVSTRMRQIVDELQAVRHKAMCAERLAAVGELAAGIAHEIRNPLTSVKLLVQTAARRYPERGLNEKQLQVLQQEISRMENTIQGLLDFARPPQLQRTTHDLRETVQRAVTLIEGRARQQGVTIRKEFPPEPLLIDGDPEQLHQVFVNLLLNGIESMAGRGAFRIAVSAEGSRPGTCQIVFSDSGGGIPDAIRERLFEPFVTSKEGGTGLGLAISRRIVEQHGGLISGVNRPEGGADFNVELPLSAQDAPEAARTPPQTDGLFTTPSWETPDA